MLNNINIIYDILIIYILHESKKLIDAFELGKENIFEILKFIFCKPSISQY